VSDERTVLVASHDRLFAEAAAGYLAERGWTVVSWAIDGLQALAAITRGEPTAVLVLGDLHRLSAGALARQVRRRWPHVSVVLVGGGSSEDAASLPPDAEGDAVVAALQTPPSQPSPVPPDSRPDSAALLRSLTSRERLVLKLLAEGLSLRDIAGQLAVSQHTVRTHMQNLYAKLGTHSRLDVLRFAARHGLLASDREEAAP
jgi:DNA-binding NarL/FixJ family response regulator